MQEIHFIYEDEKAEEEEEDGRRGCFLMKSVLLASILKIALIISVNFKPHLRSN
jgi:hypothetical protein